MKRILMIAYHFPPLAGSSGNLCADATRRDPTKKARCWVVEVCHSWFNRFRKLLVRYEKLNRRFVALNQIAAVIITFRKAKQADSIIYE